MEVSNVFLDIEKVLIPPATRALLCQEATGILDKRVIDGLTAERPSVRRVLCIYRHSRRDFKTQVTVSCAYGGVGVHLHVSFNGANLER